VPRVELLNPDAGCGEVSEKDGAKSINVKSIKLAN
jgi:hypothetical protein